MKCEACGKEMQSVSRFLQGHTIQIHTCSDCQIIKGLKDGQPIAVEIRDFRELNEFRKDSLSEERLNDMTLKKVISKTLEKYQQKSINASTALEMLLEYLAVYFKVIEKHEVSNTLKNAFSIFLKDLKEDLK
jgi:ribosome-binding protein aMBF1 (putative translation factor)